MKSRRVELQPNTSMGREAKEMDSRCRGKDGSAIPRGLELEELGVAPALGEELRVGSRRLDAPVAEHHDAVGHAHAREAVRDP